jgi:transcriptional regulator with XRE-family HTH domain
MRKSIYTGKYKNFLLRMRQARKEKGLTQVEVAELLFKPQSYIAKCENGERRVDIIELAEFAEIYGKSLSFFLE